MELFTRGCTASGMNFLLQPNDIKYQLKDSGAVAIITVDSFYEERVMEALQAGDTDVRILITTNIANAFDLELAMKEQLIKIGKITYGKVEPINLL